jgi:transposase-like protein
MAKSLKKNATAEMQEQITRLREAALELQQENLALRERLEELREKKGTPTNLEFCENVYWLLTNNERVGPFCPRCYNEHQRLATLLDGARFVAKTRWICPVCNHVFDSDT